jgi:predicted GH43/DUF377 family glycosyl hydrolase
VETDGMADIFPPPPPLERIAVLARRPKLAWEERGVCNPGAIRMPDGTIGLVYPGCGNDGVGHLGFCRLDGEGRDIIPRTRNRQPLKIVFSGKKGGFPDGYGDPRVSKIGSSYYIWAKARDNQKLKANRERYGNDFSYQYLGGRQIVAFRTKDFSRIEYLGLHGPHVFDKNSFLHPDLIIIEGVPHLALFHRIQYTIQVALAPTMDHLRDHDFWLDHIARLQDFIMLRPELEWEGVGLTAGWPGSISGGAPPIGIEADLLPYWCNQSQRHWLMFYNASGYARVGTLARDRRVGAVIFTTKTHIDLRSQPFKVISRAAEPVLLPREPYELNSRNGDVVFATSAVKTLDNKAVDLFYGSGDVVVSKARFNLRELVEYILQFDEHAAPMAR